jgi:hypothetical protein
MHVLALLGWDAIGSSVSILLLEDTFHVEASCMTWLMGVCYQMTDPAKCQCSIARVLGFVREYFSAKLYGLSYVQLLRIERRIKGQGPWPIRNT